MQYTFTHKQYRERHNRHKEYVEQHSSLIRKSADRALSLRGRPWHLPYNWGKARGNLSQGSRRMQQSIHVNKTIRRHNLQNYFISKYFSFLLVCRYWRSKCTQKRVVILLWSAPLWISDSNKNWNVSESISVIPQCQVSPKIRVAGLELLHVVSRGHADAPSFAAYTCERGRKEEKFL